MLPHSVERALNAYYFQRDLLGGRREIGRWRRRNVRALSRQFARRKEGTITPVPMLDKVEAEGFYRDFVRPHRPVVLKGAAADWPATRNWSFDAFKSRYGEETLYIAKETFDRQKTHLGYNIAFEPHTVADFVERVKAGEAIYLKFLPFFNRHPELLGDLDFAACSRWSAGSREKFHSSNEFYMGGGGTLTHLHTERSDIFHACIEGRKRWRLYAPENSVYLYPLPTKTLFFGSEVDFVAPDYEAHPWFRYANGYECVLEKGDVLYFPAFFWHAVENLTPVISANYIWHDPWRAFRAMPLFWLNGEWLRTRGKGTLDQFVAAFANRRLVNIHG